MLADPFLLPTTMPALKKKITVTGKPEKEFVGIIVHPRGTLFFEKKTRARAVHYCGQKESRVCGDFIFSD